MPTIAPNQLNAREMPFSKRDCNNKPELSRNGHTSIVLSIRPQYSRKILEKQKTVELRRKFTMRTSEQSVVYIYSTSPVCALVGSATISEVVKLPLSTLWAQYSDRISVTRAAFDTYFFGLTEGFAIVFSDAKPLPRRLPLSELRQHFDFSPPQSYRFLKGELEVILRNGHSKISN